MDVTLLLAVVALVLSLVELVRTKGQSLTVWAIALLALAMTVPWLRSL